jgi:hypothetical protein
MSVQRELRARGYRIGFRTVSHFGRFRRRTFARLPHADELQLTSRIGFHDPHPVIVRERLKAALLTLEHREEEIDESAYIAEPTS